MRLVLLVGKIVLPIVLLAAIGVGILYVRLANGPVGVGFLTSSIVSAINSELEGLRVEVPEAVVRLVGKRFEFQLKNVKLVDDGGAPVAIAPLAAFEISRKALYSGQIAPSRLVLIEPRLLLYYSPGGGLSLSFPDPEPPSKIQGRAPAVGGAASARARTPGRGGAQGAAGGRETFGRIDVARTIASLAKRARHREDASSFFESIGLRDATVIFDNAGTQSVWRVPNASFDLVHFDSRSVLSGVATVASTKGLWRLALRAEDSEKARTVSVRASARDVDLESVGDAVPGLAALKMMRIPANLAAHLALSSAGEVLAADFNVGLGRGTLDIPWLQPSVPSLEGAQLTIAYQRGRPELVVRPSTLQWANSVLTIGGTIQPEYKHTQGGDSPEGSDWAFDLVSLRGTLSPESAWAPKQAVNEWSAKGRFSPDSGTVHLDRAMLELPTGSSVMSGRIFLGARPGYDVSGGFSEMPAHSLLAHWPVFLSPDSRNYFARSVSGGKVSSGKFSAKLRELPPTQGDAGRNAPRYDWSSQVKLAFAGLKFSGNQKLPPIVAPVAEFVLDDDRFVFSIPKGQMETGKRGERPAVEGFKIEAGEIYAAKVDARLKVRLKGALTTLLPLLDRRPFGWEPVPPTLRGKIAGAIDAQLDGVLPLVRKGGEALPAPQVTGQVRLLDGMGKKLVSGYDVTGATVLVDVGTKVVSARGKLLVAGIPASLSWQHIVGAPPKKQPAVRVRATVDAADRATLGMAINHIVQGDMDLDVQWQPKGGPGLGGDIHVRADLTKADITVESLAWRKAVGQAAGLEFDVLTRDGKVAGLANIRMAGDGVQGVAIEGEAAIGPDGTITSFSFPLFSINTVTRLAVTGTRRKPDVWSVAVRGRAFEGQDLFRSLFSVGRIKPGGEKSGGGAEPGLDLDANVDSVLGFWNSTLRNVSLQMSKRNGKLETLSARGVFEDGKRLAVRVDRDNPRRYRRLLAESNDAGAAFQLIGFYPNARGGRMRLIVNLDGSGPAQKTGQLYVEEFAVLGDPVVSELAAAPEAGIQTTRLPNRRTRVTREVLAFDWMKVPFSVGHGQFAMKNAELRGPLVGAVLHGKADFDRQQVNLWGTYVPLQGLNGALGGIPVLGQLLAGPRGEGILGMTFGVQGAMASPEFLVNPLSFITPGIFREMFQLQSATPRVVPKSGVVARAIRRTRTTGDGWRKRAFESGGE